MQDPAKTVYERPKSSSIKLFVRKIAKPSATS
jgi:hypothetical protein